MWGSTAEVSKDLIYKRIEKMKKKKKNSIRLSTNICILGEKMLSWLQLSVEV